jgi:hypothetical protein
LQARLDDLAERIAVNAADMTPHAEFLAGYCASEAMAIGPGGAASGGMSAVRATSRLLGRDAPLWLAAAALRRALAPAGVDGPGGGAAR